MLEHELTPECRSILRQSAALARLGVFIVDLGTERCVYCSEQLARLHGLPLERCMALIGSDAHLELIHPDDRERYRAALAQARGAGGRYQVEYRMHDAAGTLLHLCETAEQVDRPAGAPRLVGCVQDLGEAERVEAMLEAREGGGRVLLTSDITAQRAATSALEEREHRLRMIADGVPVPIIIVRISQPEVLFVNELAAETFGFRVGPQADALRAVYVDPKDRRRLAERLQKDGRVDGFEAQLRRADGSTMWALIVGPGDHGRRRAGLADHRDRHQRAHGVRDRARGARGAASARSPKGCR